MAPISSFNRSTTVDYVQSQWESVKNRAYYTMQKDGCIVLVGPTQSMASNVESQTAAQIQKIESLPQLENQPTDCKMGSIATHNKKSAKKYPSILKRYKEQRVIQIKRMLDNHLQNKLEMPHRFADEDDEVLVVSSENNDTNNPVQVEQLAIETKEKTNDQPRSNRVQFAIADVRLKSCNRPVQVWVQLPGEDKLTLIATQPPTVESAPDHNTNTNTIKTSKTSVLVDVPEIADNSSRQVTDIASPSSPNNNVVQRSNTLYLVGLPRNTDNHQRALENHFQWCEGFKCARVPKNDDGQAKGYAFIHFLTVEQAETAMKQRCNATLSINGKVLRATFSNIIQTKQIFNTHLKNKLESRRFAHQDDELQGSKNSDAKNPIQVESLTIESKEKTNDQTRSNLVQYANADARLNNGNRPVQVWVQLPGEDKLTLNVTRPLTIKSAPTRSSNTNTINNSKTSIPDDGPEVVDKSPTSLHKLPTPLHKAPTSKQVTDIASPTLPKNNVVQRSNTLYLVDLPRSNHNPQTTLENHYKWCEGLQCARVQKNGDGPVKEYAVIHFSTAAQAETAMKTKCNAACINASCPFFLKNKKPNKK